LEQAGKIEGVPNQTNRMGILEYGYTVKLAVKEGRSSTLPLRSDDAGHQVEETTESYFRLVEGPVKPSKNVTVAPLVETFEPESGVKTHGIRV
jgi:hypothetical protein